MGKVSRGPVERELVFYCSPKMSTSSPNEFVCGDIYSASCFPRMPVGTSYTRYTISSKLYHI